MAMIFDTVDSSTLGGTAYRVGYDTETGEGYCECEGRKYRPTCRHIKTLAQRIALGVVSSDPPAEGAQTMPGAANASQGASQPADDGMQAIRPMLANPMASVLSIDMFFGDAEYRIEGGINGHRTLVRKAGRKVEAWGSDGRDVSRKLSHGIVAALRQLPDCVLDGTLFVRGGTRGDIGRKECADRLRYVAFDIIEIAGSKCGEMTLLERREILELTIQHHNTGKIDPFVFASTLARVTKAAVRAFVKQGATTIILKRTDGIYRSGQMSSDWKKFDARDFV